MTQTKRLQEIDALKGWAIFLVILGHAIIVYPINLQENAYCSALFSFISTFHVRLFFVVSGYCYSFRGDYKTYLTKKTHRLLIPYYVFCLVEMLAKLVFSGQINRPRTIGEFLIRTLFYGGDIWFLWTLFLIFVIFPLLDLLLRKGNSWEAVCLIVLFGISLREWDLALFGFGNILHYLFWFTCGVVLRKHWQFDCYPGRKSIYAVGAVFLAVLQSVLVWGTPFSYMVRDTVCGIVGILLSFALMRFSWFKDLFSRYGKYSLQLYLLNGLLLGLSRLLICSVFGVTNPAAIILFNMLMDFFLSYLLIHHILSKIRIVRPLMGMV